MGSANDTTSLCPSPVRSATSRIPVPTASVSRFHVSRAPPSLCGSQSCRALCFIPFLLRICLTEKLTAQPLHRLTQLVSHPILRLLFRRCFQRLAYFLLTHGPHHRA